MGIKWDLPLIEQFLNQLDFSKANGLVVVIAQEWKTGKVLMCAFANKEAVIRSLTTGYVHYYSRSRKKLWKKGETSGHYQEIKEVLIDCDGDAILFKIEQKIAACHEGYQSCFFRKLANSGKIEINEKKVFDPSRIY